jgi:hypothetical protein
MKPGHEPVRLPEEHAHEVCEYCGEPIPPGDLAEHKEGIDRKRMACPHQDLDEIAATWGPQVWETGALPDVW